MSIREVKEVFFGILLTFVLLQSGMEATNYVILSWTKEGLRELRLAYRGRLLLATSLASVQSSNSVVFTRATNRIRLVETVTRYGAIDDCIVSSSYRDVSSFSSEFAQLQPGKMLHVEADIMDVYLGIRNITDSLFLSKHSSSSLEAVMNASLITSTHKVIYDDYASLDTVYGTSFGTSSIVLSGKITSAQNSSFLHMFRPHLQVMKIARECAQFQKEAAKNLEMLSLLVQQDHEDALSSVNEYFNNSDRDTAALSLAHRHRHHPGGDFLRRRKIHSINSEPQVGVSREAMQSRYQQLLATVNGAVDKVLSSENTSSDFSNHNTNTSDSAGTEHTSRSSFSSAVTTNSSKPQTENIDTASEHSKTVMQVNRSLENSSSTNNNSYNTFQDGLYNEQISYMEKPTELTSPSSAYVLANHHRRKRDLLTGWMIFPGTKFCTSFIDTFMINLLAARCGDGDIAENKNDTGYHVELDKCCRRHDLCPLVISRLTWKYGMFNYRLHTLSHCRCDRKFRKCLKASSSPLAHLIGQIYFNVVGPQCFKFTQKSTCVQRHWWGGCRQYANSKVAFAKKQRRFK